jgi:hypothetical protein
VDAPGKDGNASMPEQVKRPNPWRKMMMMTMQDSAFERLSYRALILQTPTSKIFELVET